MWLIGLAKNGAVVYRRITLLLPVGQPVWEIRQMSGLGQFFQLFNFLLQAGNIALTLAGG